MLKASTFLPENLKDNELFTLVSEMIDLLLSNTYTEFTELYQAYQDTLEKISDYNLLSYDAKLEVLRESGFSYIIDVLNLSEAQVTQLTTLFNLIYALKGREEGLRLILDILKLNYTYTSWEKSTPLGMPFTATLTVILNSLEDLTSTGNLVNFIRSYMLPYVYIVTEFTVQGAPIYISGEYLAIGRVKYRKPFTYVTTL